MRRIFCYLKKFTPLQWLVHAVVWAPAIWLAIAAQRGHLTVNPIQAATQRTGFTALTLLALSLACTPLSALFGLKQALKVRRALGVYAFLYAGGHFLLFTGVDYHFDLEFLWADVGKKPYIWVGLSAGLILLALAVTSFQWWMKRLGKNWKKLHKLVYLAAPLVILHFAWTRKGNLFTLGGDMLQPLLFGLLVVALLVLRLPGVRKATRSWFSLRGRRNRLGQPDGGAHLEIVELEDPLIPLVVHPDDQTRLPG